jgi:hypothetical protein
MNCAAAWELEMIAETSMPVIPVEQLLGRFPTFCAPVLKDGDQTLAIGINFWAPQPSSDAELDYVLGDLWAQEAIDFVRDHNEFQFFCAVFNWMGARLFYEERYIGPAERGFVDGIKTRDPGALDRFIATWLQQHSGLN